MRLAKWLMPSDLRTLLMARRTLDGVSAALPALTRGVCNCTGYVARLRLSQVPVVAAFWGYLTPKSETGCAPLRPSCTITSVAPRPLGTTSTVMVCALMGSAGGSLPRPRFEVGGVAETCTDSATRGT